MTTNQFINILRECDGYLIPSGDIRTGGIDSFVPSCSSCTD